MIPSRLQPLTTALWAIAASAGAADAPNPIEVTGSRLAGAQVEPSAPVQVITKEDIERSGAITLRELLEQVSAHGGGSADFSGGASFAPGSSSASLRSMGKQATLVLLNFRRVAPYPLADGGREVFTNLDALPFEAIERIEILKIGGAAMYGSDAVAGVINIITKSGWRGLQVRASHQRSLTSGHYGSSNASITAGFGGSAESRSEWLAHVELFQRDPVMWNDVLRYVRPEVRERSPGFGSPSTYSWPGNIVGAGPIAGCEPTNVIGGLCRYDRYERFESMAESRRAHMLVSGRAPLAEGRRLFTELLIADTSTTYRSVFAPYGPGLGSVAWGNPQSGTTQSFYYRGLPAMHPLNPLGRDDVDFRYRFVDAPSQSTARTVQYRGLLGAGGSWVGMDWETAIGLAGGRTRTEQRGALSKSGFAEVIGIDDPKQVDPQFFNRTYRIGQTNSPEVIDRLFPSFGYQGHVQQWFLDGKLSGPVTRLPSGDLLMALGAELRHERFTVKPDARQRSGDIVGFGLTESDDSRAVTSAFAEFQAPMTRTLQVEAAARIDKFGGVGAHLSPKVGLRFQPDPAWLLRATAEGGFRAPNLTESAASTQYSYDNGMADPRRCPQASALASSLRAQAAALSKSDPQASVLSARADSVVGNECAASAVAIVRNNPNLKPESSRSMSAGLVFAPTKRWSLSADAWQIERHNEIDIESARELLGAEADRPAGSIARASLTGDRSFSPAEQLQYGVTAGALVNTTSQYRNQARTRTGGVDLAGRGRFDTPLGRVDLDLDAAYLTRYQVWSESSGRWGDNLAGRSSHARWRAAWGATLTRGAWSHSLRAITVSSTSLRGDFFDQSYTDEGCAAGGFSPADCRVAGTTRWDGSLSWSPSRQWTLSGHVRNLFNTRQPVAMASFLNAGGILPPSDEDAKGRMLRVVLEWRL